MVAPNQAPVQSSVRAAFPLAELQIFRLPIFELFCRFKDYFADSCRFKDYFAETGPE